MDARPLETLPGVFVAAMRTPRGSRGQPSPVTSLRREDDPRRVVFGLLFVNALGGCEGLSELARGHRLRGPETSSPEWGKACGLAIARPGMPQPVGAVSEAARWPG